MPMVDPPEGLDPLAEQYTRNARLRGYERPGDQAEQLEREAEHQAHQEVPGGGTSVRYVAGEVRDPTLDPFDLAARRAGLGLRPLAAQEPVRTTLTVNGYTVERDEESIENTDVEESQ